MGARLAKVRKERYESDIGIRQKDCRITGGPERRARAVSSVGRTGETSTGRSHGPRFESATAHEIQIKINMKNNSKYGHLDPLVEAFMKLNDIPFERENCCTIWEYLYWKKHGKWPSGIIRAWKKFLSWTEDYGSFISSMLSLLISCLSLVIAVIS